MARFVLNRPPRGVGRGPRPPPPSPASTSSLPARPARSVRPPCSARLDDAIAFMARTFGQDWRETFHPGHRLILHRPYVYCNVCGQHTQSLQHAPNLKSACLGPPRKGAAAISRLRFLQRGLGPLVPHRPLEQGAVQLPRVTGTPVHPPPSSLRAGAIFSAVRARGATDWECNVGIIIVVVINVSSPFGSRPKLGGPENQGSFCFSELSNALKAARLQLLYARSGSRE